METSSFIQVEVFRTNVDNGAQAQQMVLLLSEHFPDTRINIDLHDCDKVLRLEGNALDINKILHLVKTAGFDCGLLE